MKEHELSEESLAAARSNRHSSTASPAGSMAVQLPLPAVSLAVLTFNSGHAVYLARGDAAAVSFVASAYALLVLFFLSLRRYEAVPAGDAARKAAMRTLVWLLAAALNLLFAFRVTWVLPVGFSAVVWAVALVATGAEFYVVFCS